MDEMGKKVEPAFQRPSEFERYQFPLQLSSGSKPSTTYLNMKQLELKRGFVSWL
jgi:hypothetical protein